MPSHPPSKRQKHSHCSYCGAPFPADAAWPRTCGACEMVSYLSPTPVAVLLLPVSLCMAELAARTDETGGPYLYARRAFGKPVGSVTQLLVVKPDAAKFPVKVPNHVTAETWQSEPGKEFACLWGTGYERGRAFVEVLHRGKALQEFWTDAEVTQKRISAAVVHRARIERLLRRVAHVGQCDGLRQTLRAEGQHERADDQGSHAGIPVSCRRCTGRIACADRARVADCSRCLPCGGCGGATRMPLPTHACVSVAPN